MAITSLIPAKAKFEIVVTENGPSVIIDGLDYAVTSSCYTLEMGQNGKYRGKLVIEDLEIVDDERLLLPICIKGKTRAYYSKGYTPGVSERPDCSSADGVKPRSNIEQPLADLCADCDMSKFGDDRTPPRCREYLTVVFLDITDADMPFAVEWTFHRTSLGAWNRFMRTMRTRLDIARLKRKSMNDFAIRASIEDKGNFVVPVFEMVERPGASKFLPLQAAYFSQFTDEATAPQKPASEPVDYDVPAAAPIMAPEEDEIPF